MDSTEQKILEWCRTEGAKRNRVIGMRDATNGQKIVRYLDTMSGSYVGRYGVPEQPLRFDPDVVLAHGATWADVARELGVDGVREVCCGQCGDAFATKTPAPPDNCGRPEGESCTRCGGPCVVRFDESPEWPAAAIRGTWNGWLIPAVTPVVRDAIATWLEAADADPTNGVDPDDTTVRDIRAAEPGPDGLCVLNFGLCFQDAADFRADD